MLRRLPFPCRASAFALALRLLAVLMTTHLGIGLDDMFQYDMLARSLAAGQGYRWYAPPDAALLAPYLGLNIEELGLDPRGTLTTFRAPLYPGFLALVYIVFGAGEQRFLAARLVQAVLLATCAPLTYWIARRILGSSGVGQQVGERAARASALVVAAYPMLIVYPLGLATENLFLPLVLASFLVLVELSAALRGRGAGGPSARRPTWLAILAGILLGLSALTRSIILPFGLLAGLWLWLSLGRIRHALLLWLALLCTVAPWILRNSMLAGRLTGVETSMGYNLYLGYHPASDGSFIFGPSLDLLRIVDDVEREQVATEMAWDFIRSEPARIPGLALSRLGHFFDLEWRAFTYFYANGLLGTVSPPMLVMILLALALPFAAITVCGLVGAAALKHSPERTLLFGLAGAYILPHILILSEERFHLLLVPFLAILAAAAWVVAPGARQGSSPRKWVLASGFALLGLNWVLQIARSLPTLILLLGPGGNRLYLPY